MGKRTIALSPPIAVVVTFRGAAPTPPRSGLEELPTLRAAVEPTYLIGSELVNPLRESAVFRWPSTRHPRLNASRPRSRSPELASCGAPTGVAASGAVLGPAAVAPTAPGHADAAADPAPDQSGHGADGEDRFGLAVRHEAPSRGVTDDSTAEKYRQREISQAGALTADTGLWYHGAVSQRRRR